MGNSKSNNNMESPVAMKGVPPNNGESSVRKILDTAEGSEKLDVSGVTKDPIVEKTAGVASDENVKMEDFTGEAKESNGFAQVNGLKKNGEEAVSGGSTGLLNGNSSLNESNIADEILETSVKSPEDVAMGSINGSVNDTIVNSSETAPKKPEASMFADSAGSNNSLEEDHSKNNGTTESAKASDVPEGVVDESGNSESPTSTTSLNDSGIKIAFTSSVKAVDQPKADTEVEKEHSVEGSLKPTEKDDSKPVDGPMKTDAKPLVGDGEKKGTAEEAATTSTPTSGAKSESERVPDVVMDVSQICSDGDMEVVMESVVDETAGLDYARRSNSSDTYSNGSADSFEYDPADYDEDIYQDVLDYHQTTNSKSDEILVHDEKPADQDPIVEGAAMGSNGVVPEDDEPSYLRKKKMPQPFSHREPLSVVVDENMFDDKEGGSSNMRERANSLGTSGRLLSNVPKPRNFRLLNTSASSETGGLYADNGEFLRDDQPGSSSRPVRRSPRASSFSPPASPPHASYIDSDFELAKKLQAEEDSRRPYSSGQSNGIIEQYPLEPGFPNDIEEGPYTIDEAHSLYQQVKRLYPHEIVPEPFKIHGFNPFQLCEGYKAVLRGEAFPYEGVVPAVPPGSPKQPEQAAMASSYTATTITKAYTVVRSASRQGLPMDNNSNESPVAQRLSRRSSRDRMSSPQRAHEGSSSSSQFIDEYGDEDQPGPSNRYSRYDDSQPGPSNSWGYQDDSQPGPSNRRSRSRSRRNADTELGRGHSYYYSNSGSQPGSSNQSYDDSQPGPSNRYSSSYDDSQPGPSIRRGYSQQAIDDADEDLQTALRLSRIEHQNMLRKQAGLPELEVPESGDSDPFGSSDQDASAEAAAAAKAADDALFRVPETPRKRKMRSPVNKNEYSPLTRRPARQDLFFTVEDADEPETSSTTTAENMWPSLKWLDPEKMFPLGLIHPSEKKKMPQTYIAQIELEIEKERTAGLQGQKSEFDLMFEQQEEALKKAVEPEFMQLARSLINAPCAVPNVIADTRFEVYLRFPFLPRPIFVVDVLRALNTPDNTDTLNDVLDGVPDHIRAMSVGEFFKYAVYIWFGLKLDGSSADRPLSEPQLEVGRQTFLESVRTRLEEEAALQQGRKKKSTESYALSHLHSCSLKEVSWLDMIEMGVFQKKCMQENLLKRHQLLNRHRARYGNSSAAHVETENLFRKPACIEREEAALAEAEKAKAVQDEANSDENEAPLAGLHADADGSDDLNVEDDIDSTMQEPAVNPEPSDNIVHDN